MVFIKKTPFKNENAVFGGVKAPLEGADRSRLPGFIKYFSQRKEHFKEQFKLEYSRENAILVFKSITQERGVK